MILAIHYFHPAFYAINLAFCLNTSYRLLNYFLEDYLIIPHNGHLNYPNLFSFRLLGIFRLDCDIRISSIAESRAVIAGEWINCGNPQRDGSYC